MFTVHLFADCGATVAGIRTLLRGSAAIELHRNAERVPARLATEHGCILVDMDEPTGWWRAILAEAIARPLLPIVLLTRQPVARDIVLAMRIGARDVIDWHQDGAAVERCVRELAAVHGEPAPARAAGRCRLELLTRRQREILSLAATGLPNKAIARALSLSTRTVETHRARMVKRLMAKSFLELVRQQIRLETRA